MKLTLLGTGTSFGVPVIGCRCETCRSADPRDRRTRHAALLSFDEGTVLVDTPPELRLQLLAADVRGIDAVWITHTHADHLHGIDDLRVFTLRSGRALPVFGSADVLEDIRVRFPYIFDPDVRVPEGTSKPELELRAFSAGAPVEICGRSFQPLPLPHGPMTVWGFRVGDLGYVTDAKHLPPDVLAALSGVRVLVLNALWWGNPHPTHFNVEEAVAAARTVGAERTFLTHLTHRLGYRDLLSKLPPGILPAHDGLIVDVPESETPDAKEAAP